MMIELLPTISSLRDLSAVTGLHLFTVRRVTAPFLAIMKLNGTHPKCGCGKDRFHPFGCSGFRGKNKPTDHLPGHTREETKRLLQQREIAIDMLVDGARFAEVDAALGMSKGSASNYLRFMNDGQRRQREAIRPPVRSPGYCASAAA
ncbi:hypothetical protein VH567_15700 [Sphingomonas sp. 4RDLI-65]|uniref:hypothetical protein n=1 Tax=Sphingomonas sp. 4RDLI-65 TaxID=3111641 RepID=UPI003C1A4A2D